MAITPVDEQAAGLVSKGGATEVARDPNMQLASKGRLFPFVRDLFVKTQGKGKGKPTGRVLQDELSPDELGETYRYGAERTDQVPSDEFISGEKGQRMQSESARVPTPLEERLIKEPYKETQRRLTEKALKEGKITQQEHDAFVDSGYNYAYVKESKEKDNLIKAAKAAVQANIKNQKPGNPNLVSLSPEEEGYQFLNAREKAAITVQKDFFKSDTINLKYMETSDDVKATIEATSNLPSVDEAIQTLSQGKKSQDQIKAEALALLSDEMGVTKRFLERRIGEAFDAKTLVAGRMLLVKSAEQIEKYAAEIQALKNANQSIPTTTLLSFRRQMAIHSGVLAQLKGAQTETARALNSFKIMASGNIEDAQRIADEILTENGGEKETLRLADAYLKVARTNNPANKHNFVSRSFLSRANNLWQEGYMNGLLSGIPTQFKNIFGSAAFMLYQLPEEILAGVFGVAERGIKKAVGVKPTDGTDAGVGLEDAFARLYGFTHGLRDAISVGYDSFKTNVATDAITRADLPSNVGVSKQQLERSGFHGKFVNELGHLMRLPSRLLLGTDEFFKAVSQRGELYVQAQKAKRLALQQGKTVQEAEMDALSVMLDPRSVRQELEATGRYNTLTTDLGKIGKVLRQFQSNPIFRTLLPFVTAPTNAVLRTIERTPLSPLTKKTRDDLLGVNGQSARSKALARMTMGTGMFMATYNLAAEGRITGGFPRDKNIRRQLLESGWQPYSFVFRGKDFPRDEDGDFLPLFDLKTGKPNGKLTYISYSGIEPVGAFFGIMAQTVERMRRTAPDEERENIMSAMLFSTGNYILEQPMLMGLSSVVKAFEVEDFSRLVNSPMGNMIPFTGIIPNPAASMSRNITKIINPEATKFSQPIDLYTIEDVQNMPKDKYTGEVPYHLVGLKKTQGASIEHATTAMQYWRDIQEAVIPFGRREVAAQQYDVLGEKVFNNARFDHNPVQAVYNQIFPFKVMVGEEPSIIKQELIRIGMPLRRDKKLFVSGQLIEMSEKAKSDWSRIAKNDITLSPRVLKIPGSRNARTGAIIEFTFREAIAKKMTTRDYIKGTKSDQYAMLQTIENKFYEAALEHKTKGLLLLDEHKNLRQAYMERKYLVEKYEGLME